MDQAFKSNNSFNKIFTLGGANVHIYLTGYKYLLKLFKINFPENAGFYSK
jgi:hypothetical protein